MLAVTLTQSDHDLRGILALQQENLKKAISSETAHSQGFVTVEHDLPLLRRMHEAEPSVIAKDGDRVVGYCLTMLPSFRNDIPVLRSMFDMLDEIEFEGKLLAETGYVAMGQICVADGYRGQGLFDTMYDRFREHLSDRYPLAVTEIAVSNPRSQRAHERVGFRTIHTYFDPAYNETWNVVAWNWQPSVADTTV